MRSAVPALTLSIALAACGSSSPTPDASANTQEVTIRFEAAVSGQAFSCAQTYSGVGSNSDPAKQVFRPKFFRFYVQDVRLVDSAGQDVPVTLKDDGVFQSDGVALLNFEDGPSGTCLNAQATTNTAIVGLVSPGAYSGLKFTVGVPFEKNFLLADNQLPPLNQSSMYWSWTGGYRFMRIEGVDAAGVALPGGLLHLGSVGCTPVDTTDPRKGVTSCTAGNRPEVNFAAFDANTNKVVVDIGTLFKDTDLAANTTGSSTGCMSAPTDPECAPMFPKLGLAFGSNAAGAQTVFTME
jgi:uncharacterized repeat protein (TIGR04052 family)